MTSTRPLVFLDTETTGLNEHDNIWEIALVRREASGIETPFHAFVEHDQRLCETLPEPFLADHLARFPITDDIHWRPDVASRGKVSQIVYNFTWGATIVGAVPWFDTGHLTRQMAMSANLQPGWHHRLRDVEAMACGFLGYEIDGGLDVVCRALDIEIDPTTRHTAMGDVRMVMAVYDYVLGNS